MIKTFHNDAWEVSDEWEYFTRILKTLRYHKSIDRLDIPTTQFFFLSRLNDVSIRQYFEDSSKHFKTYNSRIELCDLFKTTASLEGHKLKNVPTFILKVLEFLLRFKLLAPVMKLCFGKNVRGHLIYCEGLRALTRDQIADTLFLSFKSVGISEVSKMFILISLSTNNNVSFGINFFARALLDKEVKSLLFKQGLFIPDDCLVLVGKSSKRKNILTYHPLSSISDSQKPLLGFLERKTDWVFQRKKSKTLNDLPNTNQGLVLIVGRRFLTRDLHSLDKDAFIQSYDYKTDQDLSVLGNILKLFLVEYRRLNSCALIVVENFPGHISNMVSKNEELKSLINGWKIALACIDPDTKEIYAFEGHQFVLKCLKHKY